MALLPWRRRSTVTRRDVQRRLEALILGAALDAKRAGDEDLAVRLWDASRTMRLSRKTWRSLAARSESELRHLVDLMVAHHGR
jgi:hypothetical protein